MIGKSIILVAFVLTGVMSDCGQETPTPTPSPTQSPTPMGTWPPQEPLEGDISAKQAQLILRGEDGDLLGSSLVEAGDLNGDGHNDFLIGASGRANDSGGVYLLPGPLPEVGVEREVDVASRALLFTGEFEGDEVGTVVASGKDLNGDGYIDIAIASEDHLEVESNRGGRVYIFFGPLEIEAGEVRSLVTADLILNGIVDRDLGSSMAMPGDITCDGYNDLLIGAVDFGSVYLVPGPIVLRGEQNIEDVSTRLIARHSNGHGTTIEPAGDFNSDGCDDVLMAGTWHYEVDHPENDYYVDVLLVYGDPYFGLTSEAVDLIDWSAMYSSNSNSYFVAGDAIAAGYDVNGDGYTDIAMSDERMWAAPDDDSNIYGDGGMVYLVLGGPDYPEVGEVTQLQSRADLILYSPEMVNGNDGEQSPYLVGDSVNFVSDLDGDGLDEIQIGGPACDEPVGSAGVVYLEYGSDMVMEFEDRGLELGNSGASFYGSDGPENLGFNWPELQRTTGEGANRRFIIPADRAYRDSKTGAVFIFEVKD